MSNKIPVRACACCPVCGKCFAYEMTECPTCRLPAEANGGHAGYRVSLWHLHPGARPAMVPSGMVRKVISAWQRVFDLAPDLRDILWRCGSELEAEHALLLTLLHASDRKRVISKEAILCECAWIVAHHQFGHDPYGRDANEQLYYLSRSLISDEDERLDRLEEYIESTYDETGKESDRDLEQIITCAECIEFWRTAPQRRRAREAAKVCEPRSTNGGRRGKADIEDLKNAIYQIVEADQPMTVRQTFYRLVAAGIIDKAESEYRGVVIRLLTLMRRAGELPYAWIADNTRWMRKPRTFNSLEEALADTAAFYRRNVWNNLPVYVEVWCEKDALAGVLLEETDPYDVPLMVARGFASESYLHSAAEQIRVANRPAYIYHFGDHDPSGIKAAEDIEQRLRGFAPGAEIHFERIAVLPEQITAMHLPTRPTKREGNSHAKGFEGDSVDLDAIPPLELRRLARECIDRHIPPGYLESLEVAENSEREILTRIANSQSSRVP
jgi:hypothetical protein